MSSRKSKKTNHLPIALGLCLPLLFDRGYGDVLYRKTEAIRLPEKTAHGINSGEDLQPTKPNLEIIKIQKADEKITALLYGNFTAELLPGTLLESSRPSSQSKQASQWIPTAQLKVLEVRPHYTLAEVIADGSQDSKVYFPEAPGLMVGDSAEIKDLKISQSIRIVPNRVLRFDQLFIDPKNFPSSFELSSEGRSFLFEQSRAMVQAHAPLLIVEAHTDPKGDSQSNQVESFQRAMTIRQALIEEFGLPPARILAVGMGESEPLEQSYLPGRAEEARRIVLKIKAQPQPL